MQQHPAIRHFPIEDGEGLPLGRSFHVKLWPTFVLLRDGQAVSRLERPSAAQLGEAVRAMQV